MSTSACEILLIRHPETVANSEGRFVGRGSTPYTQRGHRQSARALRAAVAFGPDRVRTSTLRRCALLAMRIGRALELEPILDDRLVELDFGAAEGLTYDEAIDAGIAFDYRRFDAPVAPGGESREQLAARLAPALDEVRAIGGRHVIVTHAGVLRAAMILLLDLPAESLWAFQLENAHLVRIRVVEGHGVLCEYRPA